MMLPTGDNLSTVFLFSHEKEIPDKLFLDIVVTDGKLRALCISTGRGTKLAGIFCRDAKLVRTSNARKVSEKKLFAFVHLSNLETTPRHLLSTLFEFQSWSPRFLPLFPRSFYSFSFFFFHSSPVRVRALPKDSVFNEVACRIWKRSFSPAAFASERIISRRDRPWQLSIDGILLRREK